MSAVHAKSEQQVPDEGGRVAFLLALRRHCPVFWRDLNKAWKEAIEQNSKAPLDAFLVSYSVVDDWFIDACQQTVYAWARDPDGPNATLQEGFPWFRLPTPEYEVPDFAPVFVEPYPKHFIDPDFKRNLFEHPMQELTPQAMRSEQRSRRAVAWEETEEFEARMRAQFEKQLRAYVRTIKAWINYGSRSLEPAHAFWTVGLFLGKSPVTLSRRFANKGGYPDTNTIAKSGKRFAARIGLTLPKRNRLTLGDSLT